MNEKERKGERKSERQKEERVRGALRIFFALSDPVRAPPESGGNVELHHGLVSDFTL